MIAAHDETLRHLLGTSLQRFNHDVHMSVNGKHILYLIRQDIFDLVILDEKLQDTTALAILDQLSGSENPKTIIMVMSAKSSHAYIKDFVDAGATDFVVKPFSLPKVILRIEVLLEEKWWEARPWSEMQVCGKLDSPMAAVRPDIT